MISKSQHLTILTIGLFLSSTVFLSGASTAAQVGASTLELSAQANVDPKKKPPPPKPQPQVQQKQINVQPKVNVQQKQINVQQKNINVQQKQINVQQKNINVQQQKQLNIQQQKQINVQQQKQLNIQQQKNIQLQKKVVVQPKVFTPKHNNVVYKFKLKNANQAFVSGKNYSVFRRDYRIRHHGAWRTFVALSVLAPLVIAGSQYYPYAYMDAPGDYCSGLTEDGCELVYDEVQTLEGDIIPQCVAYCPWQ